MRPVRTISRKDLGDEAPDHVHGPVWTSSESSETIRQTRCRNVREDMVRSVWRHAEAGRNDQPTQSLVNPQRKLWCGLGLGSNKMPKVAKSLVG